MVLGHRFAISSGKIGIDKSSIAAHLLSIRSDDRILLRNCCAEANSPCDSDNYWAASWRGDMGQYLTGVELYGPNGLIQSGLSADFDGTEISFSGSIGSALAAAAPGVDYTFVVPGPPRKTYPCVYKDWDNMKTITFKVNGPPR
jgi:hypothetical protein